MNGKDQYSGLDLRTRKMLLGSFRVFFRHMPVKYHTFAYATKQFASLDELAGTMRRDLVNFLFDNLAELQSYDMAKVYYDNGQHSIAESLHRAVEYALSKGAALRVPTFAGGGLHLHHGAHGDRRKREKEMVPKEETQEPEKRPQWECFFGDA